MSTVQRIAAGPAWPLWRAAQAPAQERLAQATTTEPLMDRAGRAAARLALALAPHAQRVWIACGPGNNGGDGLEAALQLRQMGREVWVSLLDPAQGPRPADAQRALARAQAAGVTVLTDAPLEVLAQMGPQDLCIDALLGVGARRAPTGRMADWVARLNRSPAPVLALDLPTGLAPDSGQPLQDAQNLSGPVVHAAHTLAMLAVRPGLWMGQGRDCAGQVWLAPLVDPSPWAEQAPDAWLNPAPAPHARRHASHKGTHGDVAVVGGEGLARRGQGMQGAAVLAAQAALHAGAGRVLLAWTDAPDAAPVLPPELMPRQWQALPLDSLTVVAGCGGGLALDEVLAPLIRHSARLVLDADALNALARDPQLQALLAARGQQHGAQATVLTPHPLEAARLLATDTAQVMADRLQAAQTLADRHGVTLVLKGSGTVIAAPGQVPQVNPTGNGRLACGGTGDVLAGLIGARMAQGLAGPLAAQAAVWQHGALADRWPADHALTAGALARALS